jgi:hypothetical protein
MGDARLAGVDPHPLFDAAFYGPVMGEHGLAHYRREGWRQGVIHIPCSATIGIWR